MRVIVEVRIDLANEMVNIWTGVSAKTGTVVEMSAAQTREFIDGLESAICILNPNLAKQAAAN